MRGSMTIRFDRVSFRGVSTHDDHGSGIADIVEAVGHRAVAPRIGYAGNGGRMADARLVIGVIGAPEGAELAKQIRTFVGEFRRPQPVDRIGARLGTDIEQLVADLVDRLVPGNPRPLAARKLHRITQAAFAVDQLAYRRPLGTMRAAIDRTVPTRLLSDPDAVGDLGRDGAANRAVSTDALADGNLRTRRRRRSSLGLAHGAEPQGSNGGDTAGGEPGTAQECAAVETAIRCRHLVRERTAANVPFFALDQHDCLPQP